jgi:hypothetical protein
MSSARKPNLSEIRARLGKWNEWTKEDIRQFVEHDLPSVIDYAEELEQIVKDLYEKAREA